jgi:hypothetical protein
MHFAIIGLFIPFTLLFFIEDYYLSLHLLFAWFYTFVYFIFEFQLFILAPNLVPSVVACFVV